MIADHIPLINLVLNTLVIPALLAVGRLLWRTERRLLRIELRLGIVDTI